jgi:hypothetical protein
MANEDVKCSFGNCQDPAFFRIENLRDEVKKEYCRKHYAHFLISGLNKLQQAAMIENIKRQTGVDIFSM